MKQADPGRCILRLGGILCALATTSVVVLFATAASAQPAGDATQGKAAAERWCNACHVIGPGGRGSDMAPNFSAIARSRDDTYLKGFLTRPHPPMPRVELSRQDIADLVAYFNSLRPR
jgi:mono/diheme cytochrome c family protein